MADAKLSALVELAVAPATNDEIYIRDVSEAAANESKRITVANFMAALGFLFINVAASTSTTAAKAACVASGQTVCDGTDDEVQLQAAIDLADNLGQAVFVAAGHYNIESTDLTISCKVVGESNFNDGGTVGTQLHVSAARRVIIKGQQGKLLDIFVGTQTKVAVLPTIEVLSDATIATAFDGQGPILDNVTVENWNADQTGIGIYVHAESIAAGSWYVQTSMFGRIHTNYFAIGLYIHANETAGAAHCNNLTFTNFYSYHDERPLKLYAEGTSEVFHTRILSFQCQPDGNTIDIITLDGHIEYADINCQFSDLHLKTGYSVRISSINCLNNHIYGNVCRKGQWADELINAGINNVVETNGLKFILSVNADNITTGDFDALIGVAGYNVAYRDMVYLGSDGEWHECDADAAGTSSGLLGCVIDETTPGDGDPCAILLKGTVSEDSWNLTVGATCYLSVTLGAFSATAPVGAGDQVRIVGYMLNADTLFFNPGHTIVVVAA